MTPLPHSVSCWNLAGLSERVAKETVNEINLQFHVRRLREKQDSKPAVYRANIQICNLFVSCICVHIQNSDRWRRSCEAFFKKKNRKSFSVWVVQLVSAMSWHWGLNTKLMKSNFRAHFEIHSLKSSLLMDASFFHENPNEHGRCEKLYMNHDSKTWKQKACFQPDWKPAAAITNCGALLASCLCSVGVSVSYLARVVLRPCF